MIDAVGKSDIGRVRKANQDAYHIGKASENMLWSVVCDGMGGTNGGNVASLVAVGAISSSIDKNYHDEKDDLSVRNMLVTAVIGANTQVYQKSRSTPELSGMGTTVVLALVRGNKAFVVHAGDSRAYHLTREGISQVTKDHTVVQYLLETGELTKEEVKNHPKKHLITRALGVEENVDADYNEFEVSVGDKLVLCTDGLTNMVSETEIQHIVAQNAATDAADALVELANERGGNDNITVVIIEIN